MQPPIMLRQLPPTLTIKVIPTQTGRAYTALCKVYEAMAEIRTHDLAQPLNQPTKKGKRYRVDITLDTLDPNGVELTVNATIKPGTGAPPEQGSAVIVCQPGMTETISVGLNT